MCNGTSLTANTFRLETNIVLQNTIDSFIIYIYYGMRFSSFFRWWNKIAPKQNALRKLTGDLWKEWPIVRRFFKQIKPIENITWVFLNESADHIHISQSDKSMAWEPYVLFDLCFCFQLHRSWASIGCCYQVFSQAYVLRGTSNQLAKLFEFLKRPHPTLYNQRRPIGQCTQCISPQ